MTEKTTQTVQTWLARDEVPNAETREAMREVDEMISNGTGDAFSGSTADFLRQLAEG